MEATLIIIAIASFILVAISAYHLGKSSSDKYYLFKEKDESDEAWKLVSEKDEQIARLKNKVEYLKTFRYNEALVDADFDEKKGEENNDN